MITFKTSILAGNGQMAPGSFNNRVPRPNIPRGGAAVNGRGRAIRR